VTQAPNPSRRRCPQCGKEYGRNAVVCTECGVDIDTGERFSAEIGEDEIEEEVEEAGPGSVGRQMLIYFAEVFPGLARPVLVLFSILIALIGLVLLALGLTWLFATGDFITGMTMGGVGLVLYAQGAAWVLTGEYFVLKSALAELDSARWQVFFVLMILPFGAFMFAMKQIAAWMQSKGG
jgi:hypothetical protein